MLHSLFLVQTAYAGGGPIGGNPIVSGLSACLGLAVFLCFIGWMLSGRHDAPHD